MNTFGHIRIAEHIYQLLKEQFGITLNHTAFVLGNISPDFSLALITRPHYLHLHVAEIQEEIDALIHQWHSPDEFSFSRRVGVVCHFYTDFFCYAHQEAYPGTMKDHIKYESDLTHWLKQHEQELSKLSVTPSFYSGDIHQTFRRLQEEFHSVPHSFFHDAVYSIRSCTEMAAIVSSRMEIRQTVKLAA